MTEIATSTDKTAKIAPDRFLAFRTRFQSDIQAVSEFRGDLAFDVSASKIPEMARVLKQDFGFDLLVDLFGMDYSEYAPNVSGLAVIYIFYSLKNKYRIRLRARLTGDSVPSLCGLFAAANWFEREAWDLFGIRFEGHPGLKRILCHNDFEGHALRKEYPADRYQRLKSAISSAEM